MDQSLKMLHCAASQEIPNPLQECLMKSEVANPVEHRDASHNFGHQDTKTLGSWGQTQNDYVWLNA